MYWQDSESDESFVVPDDVQDLSFRINVRVLPLDHAVALSDSLQEQLPWLKDELRSAIHLIHYPESGSGWERAEDSPNHTFNVSRRCRLRLRLTKNRIADAQLLTGKTLWIDGFPMEILNCNPIPLSLSTTLFARRVVQLQHENESTFIQRIISELQDIGIEPQKVLCGKTRGLQYYDQVLKVRSVMLADLSRENSLTLQQTGLGDKKLYGCGIFIPHKAISQN